MWAAAPFSGSGEIVADGIVLAMKITLLAMHGAFDLGLAAALDTLETANELAASMDSPPPPLVVSLVGIGRRVRDWLAVSWYRRGRRAVHLNPTR